MDLFKCPVCQNGTVEGEKKDKKVVCNTCGSLFLFEKGFGNHYILKKLENDSYKERFKELRKRQSDVIGLSLEDWDSIANGGNTKEEQKVIDRKQKAADKEKTLNEMIIITTNTVEGKSVKQYLGIVTGQVAAGIGIFKDAFAGIRNVVGGRSEALQSSMKTMREEAIKDIKEEAFSRGANAIIGVSLDFDEYAEGMMLLTVSGTAVVI